MRRKKAQPSPFRVPESNGGFPLGAMDREKQREEQRKFLALPIQEKTAYAAKMMAKLKNELLGEVVAEEEEEEEVLNEKKKTLKQTKSKMGLPKETSGRHELKMAMMKRENITKQSRHHLMSMERQTAVLEFSMMRKRSEMSKMDKTIAKEERQLKQLEKVIERDNHRFEEFLRENERKSVEARTLFEREEKSKKEKNVEIRKLNAQIGTMKSEVTKLEETLTDFKRYEEFLFKLSPPEWQDEQKSKAATSKGLSDKDGQDDQSKEPGETATDNGKYFTFTMCIYPLRVFYPLSRMSLKEEPELYFTDPKQLLNLMTELTDQNLSLIQNSARVEEALEAVQRATETTKRQIEKDEAQLLEQINYMNQKITKEKARQDKLQQKLQLHLSLNTEDQDMMLQALREKVTEVHSSCVEDGMTNLSTLEKVGNIESCISALLQDLKSIPEGKLQLMERIKESEKRTRQHEEKIKEQKEKREERMRKYSERALADSKKITGRKLMPRCRPVAPRAKVSNVDNIPAEEDMHEYLYGEDTD
ncbi:cilia- and flagella-associated protein 100 [Cololabis saira]|uniref:cilia- and flagella-associated protein 100 n=1 Tax=Cololabis saira TaxID=129043 RepID=UPI002AD2509A|nr:cilia- and flagella-associated protein 100 [Cololabis saira]